MVPLMIQYCKGYVYISDKSIFMLQLQIATFSFFTMIILFQRQLQDDNNAITAEYDLYSDGDEYDSIERQGKADEGSFDIFNNSFNKFKF